MRERNAKVVGRMEGVAIDVGIQLCKTTFDWLIGFVQFNEMSPDQTQKVIF